MFYILWNNNCEILANGSEGCPRNRKNIIEYIFSWFILQVLACASCICSVWAWHTYAIYLSIAVGTLQDLTICQGSGRCCSSIFSLSLLHSLFSLLLNRLLELALTIAAEDYRKSIIRRTLHGNKMAKRFCIVLLIFLCFAWNLANAIKIHQRASNLMCILFNRHIIQLDYVYCIIS